MLNTAEITLNGSAVKLRASNWARQLYAEEFQGKLPDPWTGSLDRDGAQLFSSTTKIVHGEDGESSVVVTVPPTAIWPIVWALAAAAGSVEEPYQQWWQAEVRDECPSDGELAEIASVVIDLLMRTFFRDR